jgi:hypothetical protein
MRQSISYTNTTGEFITTSLPEQSLNPPLNNNPYQSPLGQQAQYGYPPYRMQMNQELSTTTTFILIAFIFSIISTVLFLIAAIIEEISISYINSV